MLYCHHCAIVLLYWYTILLDFKVFFYLRLYEIYQTVLIINSFRYLDLLTIKKLINKDYFTCYLICFCFLAYYLACFCYFFYCLTCFLACICYLNCCLTNFCYFSYSLTCFCYLVYYLALDCYWAHYKCLIKWTI